MASLHSVLIQTCMANIHKEINQLEHWLITLPNQGVPAGESIVGISSLQSLTAVIEGLSKKFDVQQHALNHIVDRLDILERDRDPVDSQESAPNDYLDPWIDSSRSPLQNEIIDVLEPAYKLPDPVYTVHKTETLFEPPFAPVKVLADEPAVEIVPVVQEVITALDKIVAPVTTLVEAAAPVAPAPVAVVAPVAAAEPVPVPVAVAAPVPAAEPVEEEEEEEEDEGLELDTIEFNGISYYRDEEGFIYGIMEDEQPSETAIGLWKEKTKTIKFYRTS